MLICWKEGPQRQSWNAYFKRGGGSKEWVGAVKTAPGRAEGAGVGQDVERRIPSVFEVGSPGLGDSQVWARR